MMNTKIKELAEQAGFMDAWYSESGDDCETELKKFAELLLRETTKIIDERMSIMEVDNDYDNGVIRGMELTIHIVEKYFRAS